MKPKTMGGDMLLQELISDPLIIIDLAVSDKDEALEELTDCFVLNNVVGNKEEFLAAIKKREDIESTGIGEGIAIPHARCDSVKGLKVVFAKARKGVDFKALDRRPVRLIFMIAAPTELRKPYLQAVAKVARFLKSTILKKALLDTESPEAVMDLVRDFDGVVPESLEVKTKEGRVIYKKKKKNRK